MRQYAAAYFCDRKQPETFCLTLAMRMSLSERLFVNATWGFRVKRRISVSWRVKASCRFSASDLATRPRLPLVRRGGSGSSCFALVRMVR